MKDVKTKLSEAEIVYLIEEERLKCKLKNAAIENKNLRNKLYKLESILSCKERLLDTCETKETPNRQDVLVIGAGPITRTLSTEAFNRLSACNVYGTQVT